MKRELLVEALVNRVGVIATTVVTSFTAIILASGMMLMITEIKGIGSKVIEMNSSMVAMIDRVNKIEVSLGRFDELRTSVQEAHFRIDMVEDRLSRGVKKK